MSGEENSAGNTVCISKLFDDVWREKNRRECLFLLDISISCYVQFDKREVYCLSFFFILLLPVTFSTTSLKTFVSGITDMLNGKSS